MLEYADLPKLNTTLNTITAVLLLVGYHAIKVRKDEARHKRIMLSAAVTSALFLISYVIYHAKVGSVPYPGEGLARKIYLGILLTHVVLAIVNVPLVVMTLYHGLKDHRERHKKIARITFPIWLYVSITGVVVYFMLYGATH